MSLYQRSSLPSLSILIPIYNYDVTKLVGQLESQIADLADYNIEIIVYDDYSRNEMRRLNHPIASNKYVHYVELFNNVGRAAIRNMMARSARFDKLLFLDGDSELVYRHFVRNYLEACTQADAVAGGTVYAEQLPTPELALRWAYGRQYEQKTAAERSKNPFASLTLNNFLIDKELFMDIGLGEELKGYGHEDTLFGFQLKKRGITLSHINNPVLHAGLETAEVYLQKTAEAVGNLHTLITKNNLGQDTRLYKTYRKLKSMLLLPFVLGYYRLFKGRILKNLHSTHPSLLNFNLFKLNALAERFAGK